MAESHSIADVMEALARPADTRGPAGELMVEGFHRGFDPINTPERVVEPDSLYWYRLGIEAGIVARMKK